MSIDKELYEAACQARQNAYAPYSHYLVGCAILNKEGKIIAGCNIENACFRLGICAEQSAVSQVQAQGGCEGVTKIAIVTEDGGSPCGGCRQTLIELCPNATVSLYDKNGNRRDITIKDTLPDAYEFPSDKLSR